MIFQSDPANDVPRRGLGLPLWHGSCFAAAAFMVAVGVQSWLTPVRDVDPISIWSWPVYWDDYQQWLEIEHRLLDGLAIALVGGAVVAFQLWRTAPRREPFRQINRTEPRIRYDADAGDALRHKLVREAGARVENGLYLAPYLPLPRSTETKNIMVIGAPNSGKSNILRALSDQSIARGDHVLLLCNKGDVTQSFLPSEAILIAAHDARSFAWDLAADIADPAAAAQFAVDLVPASSPPFWSDSARIVLTDLIMAVIAEHQGQPTGWTARDLMERIMSDSDTIRAALRTIDLGAAPLLESGDPDGDDKAVTGILSTMRSAAQKSLRPLAWAWAEHGAERRFSVKRWLANDHRGQKTVIVQMSPEYEELSTLVGGGLLRLILRRLADPAVAVDRRRRVVLALDEFHALGRLEGIERALSVGREKGLVVLLGIPSFDDLIKTYGSDTANVLFGLCQIKIYGRLVPGAGTDLIVKSLGTRTVPQKTANLLPAKEDTRKEIEERHERPVFSATRLAGELGVEHKAAGTGDVRALVHAYGQCYVLDWPFHIWNVRRRGAVPAAWLGSIPKAAAPHAPPP